MSDAPQAPNWWQATDGKWYPPAVPAATTGSNVRPGLILIMGGAAALVIGSFLPWIKASAVFVGTITKSGVEGGDGWFLIGLAVGLVVLGWPLVIRHPVAKGAALGLVVVAAAALALTIYELVDVSARIEDLKNDDAGAAVVASVGIGLFLCLAGAVAAGAGGLMEWSAAKTRGQAAAASAPF